MFVGVMVALAYERMVSPVRSSVLVRRLTVPTCALVIIFLATTLRFFIGALLHLYEMAKDPLSWLIDFLVIFFECLIMIFMGGLCSVQANRRPGEIADGLSLTRLRWYGSS